MTKEELSLYSMPRIQKYRGEWQVGDRAYNIAITEKALIISVDSYSDDRVTFLFSGGVMDVNKDDCSFIWLLLPVDPANLGRGLWGMVDWSHAELRSEGEACALLTVWDGAGDCSYYRVDYTTALVLLKAIEKQQEAKNG